MSKQSECRLYYKVVGSTDGRWHSVFAPPALRLHYALDEPTVPVVGGILVFAAWECAVDFYSELCTADGCDRMLILEGEGGTELPLPPVAGIQAELTIAFATEIWDETRLYGPDEFAFLAWPNGTVALDRFTPRRTVSCAFRPGMSMVSRSEAIPPDPGGPPTSTT